MLIIERLENYLNVENIVKTWKKLYFNFNSWPVTGKKQKDFGSASWKKVIKWFLFKEKEENTEGLQNKI